MSKKIQSWRKTTDQTMVVIKMKIDHVEFVISAVGPQQYPNDALPEIALAGRSNVGKSSLINRMIGRKNLARTSSKPGKTQTLNFYRIHSLEPKMYFVDLPGYGYAQVSKTLRIEWGKFIERYLLEREQLKLLILIIDLRHPPTKDDQSMAEWVKYNEIPLCVVATKADKISKNKWPQHMKVVKETLGLDAEDELILFSSETGVGKEELWNLIQQKSSMDHFHS